MRLSHTPARTRARFDDPNLVSHAGLVPLIRLTDTIDLPGLAHDLVRLGGPTGANPGAKITTILAGMTAGADSIDDLDQLRHGAMTTLFTGIRAPSTLGTFLRWFTPGHNAQLENLAATALARLATHTPLLPGTDQMALVDLDSTTTQVYGRQKRGARVGHKKIRGLDFLAATVSTPTAAPVITSTRPRGGNADTRRKITSFATRALRVVRGLGATGTVLVRGDSGCYVGELIAALTAAGALFSITARWSPALRRAVAAIQDDAWTPITYDTPVIDEDTGELVHTARLAETTHTAFTNPTQNPGRRVTARLIVRRHRVTTVTEQGESLPVWRYHAVLTNSPADLVAAEAQHRGRAGAIEQVFADLNNSALAHFPSGHFAANAAWLTLAAVAHNLQRALGVLAGGALAKARTATLRSRLIAVPARISHSARTLTLHLPRDWPWRRVWRHVFDRVHAPPLTV
jgi:hypothetical protein